MKYALFGLGVLLIVIGGYFIYTGSNIIEVERGWSSVIAGTTALTGGIITLGLAGVVKSLDDLRQLWAAGVSKPQALSSAIVAEPSPVAAEIPEAIPQGPVPAGVETAPLPADITFAGAEPTPAAPDVLPSPFTARLAPRFGPPPFHLEAEATPPEPVEAITPPPFDFIDFGADETVHDHFEHGQTTHSENSNPSEPPPLPREPEPPPALESGSIEAMKPTAKAIGRYEAEGIVYVMFADGSIDAQSSQGTRHYKSMTDLKASFQSKS